LNEFFLKLHGKPKQAKMVVVRLMKYYCLLVILLIELFLKLHGKPK
jgi:hypothetical protein